MAGGSRYLCLLSLARFLTGTGAEQESDASSAPAIYHFLLIQKHTAQLQTQTHKHKKRTLLHVVMEPEQEATRAVLLIRVCLALFCSIATQIFDLILSDVLFLSFFFPTSC